MTDDEWAVIDRIVADRPALERVARALCAEACGLCFPLRQTFPPSSAQVWLDDNWRHYVRFAVAAVDAPSASR
jgi:hypothetical protein